jgi:two-component system cell cycle sensor histidine kinase/response regulator CckA
MNRRPVSGAPRHRRTAAKRRTPPAAKAAASSLEARFAETQEVARIGSWEWTIADDSHWWSDELYRISGLQPGSVSPSFDAFLNLVHPDDREMVSWVIRQALADYQPFAFEHRLVRSDGDVRTLHARGRVVRDAFGNAIRVVATAQEITEREANVRLSERRLQAIINAEPACVKLVSLDGRLLDMNPAGLAMIDAADLSQLVGRSIIDLVHPEDRSRFVEIQRRATTAPPATGEYRIIGFSGRERWVESHSVPFDTFNGGRAILSVTSDITERKRLEEQLRQSQKMEAVGRLAGGIAHDFNNLLTVIAGCTDTALAQLPGDARVSPILREVARAADSAAALTRQLLIFSRKQTVRLSPLDLNAVITEIEQLLNRTLGEDIEIVTSLPSDLGAIHGDATQLQQVLMNMAVNARDAMPRGGILTIETRNVDPHRDRRSGGTAGALVELCVSDTGSGMDDSTKARIFEPFFTTKQLGHGAGLGLATVYAIVEGMGGTIQVVTERRRGTTFQLRFPRCAAPAETTPARLAAPVTGGFHGTETILLVEDDDKVRAYAATVLKNAGYDVMEASRPATALKMAERSGSTIHLLLSDLIMPGFDGVELTKRFRVSHPHTPVLFMSGYSDEIMARHGLTGDQYELLVKPFSTNNLLKKVREVLSAAN